MPTWRQSVEEFLLCCQDVTTDESLVETLVNIIDSKDTRCLSRLLESAVGYEIALLRDKKQATLLHHATNRQNVELAEQLLQRGADVNAACKRGFTPLHVAACVPDGRLARLLLDAGANSNACNNFMDTPLTLAAFSGGTDVLRALVERHSSLNWSSAYGYTALYNAIEEEHVTCVRILLDAGARADCAIEAAVGGATPLILASQRGLHDVIDMLRAQDCNVNALECTDGWSALHYSAARGSLASVRALLKFKDVDVNLRSSSGVTSLMLAVSCACVEVALELVGTPGCALDLCDAQSGMTALHRAADIGLVDVVHALLTAGCHPSLLDKERASPLLLAVNGGHVLVVRALIGAGVSARRHSQLLSLAATRGQVGVVYALLHSDVTFSVAQVYKWRLIFTIATRRLSTDCADMFECLEDHARTPRALGVLCRDVIVTSLPPQSLHLTVTELPLPTSLQRYIRREDVFTDSSTDHRNT